MAKLCRWSFYLSLWARLHLLSSTVSVLPSFCTGLSTFENQIRGRKLVVWSDNKGAELSTKKGERLHAVRLGLSLVLTCKDLLAPSIIVVCCIVCGAIYWCCTSTPGSCEYQPKRTCQTCHQGIYHSLSHLRHCYVTIWQGAVQPFGEEAECTSRGRLL